MHKLLFVLLDLIFISNNLKRTIFLKEFTVSYIKGKEFLFCSAFRAPEMHNTDLHVSLEKS